jgi:MFS family permease
MFLFMGPASSLQGSNQDVKPSSFSYLRLLKSKNTLIAGASLFMATYASFTITSWTPTYLVHIGMKSALTGVVIGAYALTGGIGAILSGRLADAWGEKRLVVSTGVGAALVSVPLYLWGLNFASALVLMALVGFLLWPYWNLTTSMVQRLVDPAVVGSITGLVQNIGMLGGFLGPILTGLLISYYGYGPAMAGSVVVSLWLYVLLVIPFREAPREDTSYGVEARDTSGSPSK